MDDAKTAEWEWVLLKSLCHLAPGGNQSRIRPSMNNPFYRLPQVRTTTSANYLTAQCLDYCVGTCDNCTRNQPAGNSRPGLVVEAIPECNLTY